MLSLKSNKQILGTITEIWQLQTPVLLVSSSTQKMCRPSNRLPIRLSVFLFYLPITQSRFMTNKVCGVKMKIILRFCVHMCACVCSAPCLCVSGVSAEDALALDADVSCASHKTATSKVKLLSPALSPFSHVSSTSACCRTPPLSPVTSYKLL